MEGKFRGELFEVYCASTRRPPVIHSEAKQLLARLRRVGFDDVASSLTCGPSMSKDMRSGENAVVTARKATSELGNFRFPISDNVGSSYRRPSQVIMLVKSPSIFMESLSRKKNGKQD